MNNEVIINLAYVKGSCETDRTKIMREKQLRTVQILADSKSSVSKSLDFTKFDGTRSRLPGFNFLNEEFQGTSKGGK